MASTEATKSRFSELMGCPEFMSMQGNWKMMLTQSTKSVSASLSSTPRSYLEHCRKMSMNLLLQLMTFIQMLTLDVFWAKTVLRIWTTPLRLMLMNFFFS